MKSTVNSRKFRPTLERLETVCLLSGGVHASAVVHAMTIVDLKPTTVGTDAISTISNSTPHSRRGPIHLVILMADSSTNTITGFATETYKIPIIGNITATIQFKTDIDSPKPGNIKVSANKFSSFIITSRTKSSVQRAVVNFLKQDHDQIVALLKA